MLTTSGACTYKMDAIDAIAGQSILDEVSVFVDKVVGMLSPLLTANYLVIGLSSFGFVILSWHCQLKSFGY